MKTISEAAKDYILGNRQGYPSKSEDEDMDIFTAGVKFAQQWIPVEEELPEIGDQVIVKNEHRKETRKISSIYDIKDITEFATHWRPIELK
jgi:hypothetical protein